VFHAIQLAILALVQVINPLPFIFLSNPFANTGDRVSCTACSGLSYLYQGQCLINCPTGYYISKGNHFPLTLISPSDIICFSKTKPSMTINACSVTPLALVAVELELQAAWHALYPDTTNRAWVLVLLLATPISMPILSSTRVPPAIYHALLALALIRSSAWLVQAVPISTSLTAGA